MTNKGMIVTCVGMPIPIVKNSVSASADRVCVRESMYAAGAAMAMIETDDVPTRITVFRAARPKPLLFHAWVQLWSETVLGGAHGDWKIWFDVLNAEHSMKSRMTRLNAASS